MVYYSNCSYTVYRILYTYSDYSIVKLNKRNKINIYEPGTTKGPAPKAPEDQEDIIGGLKILK